MVIFPKLTSVGIMYGHYLIVISGHFWSQLSKFGNIWSHPAKIYYTPKCPPNQDVGGQMSSKFIVVMSSYLCNHCQNWTNVLQL